jgi:hypothetical protein
MSGKGTICESKGNICAAKRTIAGKGNICADTQNISICTSTQKHENYTPTSIRRTILNKRDPHQHREPQKVNHKQKL